MLKTIYDQIDRVIETKIPDLSLAHYPVLDEKTAIILFSNEEYDEVFIEQAMLKICRTYSDYLFMYHYKPFCLEITINRKSQYL